MLTEKQINIQKRYRAWRKSFTPEQYAVRMQRARERCMAALLRFKSRS